MEQIQEDLTLKDLNQYYATENYYKVMGLNVTDGINYIMKNGYCWFVTDFLSLIVTNHKNLRAEQFLSIKLKVTNKKAVMEVTDGNEKILYKQEYEYTDAKRDLSLFFTDEVLLLSGEYQKMKFNLVYFDKAENPEEIKEQSFEILDEVLTKIKTQILNYKRKEGESIGFQIIIKQLSNLIFYFYFLYSKK